MSAQPAPPARSAAKVVVDFTISLDGYAAGPDVGIAQPMGEGGERLHDWLFAKPVDALDMNIAKRAHAAASAVVLGRRTFDVGIGVWEDTPFPAACFVVTHRPQPPRAEKSGVFTFVGDGVESAIRQARDAAGEGIVRLMGADVAHQAIDAGLVDEIHLQIAPVLLGDGVRLFERLRSRNIELERISVIASARVTHLHYRVCGRR